MTGALHDFQAAFVRDLMRPVGSAACSRLAEQPGFAVYRNTVLTGCIDALAANYPTVRQIVGADCFADAARAYALRMPPCSGRLGDYGDSFATFLATFDACAELDYLPAVASLDRCWTEAHFAADAPVLHAGDFAGLSAEALGRARLQPHPAARWRTFATAPIYTVWRRHREGLPLDGDLPWHGESALLTRPRGAVAWRALPPAAAAFMDACAAGQRFGEAAEDAAAAGEAGEAGEAERADLVPATDEPGGDLASSIDAWLPRLIGAGAFTRIERDAE